MNINEMLNSVAEAEKAVRNAEQIVDRMARFISNRLRLVGTSTLRTMKKELQNFNSVTGEWKN